MAYSELESLLQVRREDGLVVVSVGLLATVYFWHAESRTLRAGISDVFDEYEQLCRSYLRWKRHPGSLKFNDSRRGSVPSPREWFSELGAGDEWEFNYRGGDAEAAASEFCIRAYGPPTSFGALGFLSISLPLSWYTDHAGSWPAYVHSICERIRPFHGYGGVGILESPDRSVRGQYEPEVFKIAKRFQGLEVDYPAIHSVALEQGIKGVNWLTILSDELVGRLGGIKALERSVPDETRLMTYEGGLLIQIGERPEIGDVQAGRAPSGYSEVSALMTPVRIKDHRPFQQASALPHFDKGESVAWLARFDRA